MQDRGSKETAVTGLLDQELVKVGGRGRDVEFTLDDDVPIEELERGIRSYLANHGKWFAGGTISVNAGRRLFNVAEVGRIRQVLTREFGLYVAKFWCVDEVVSRVLDDDAGSHFNAGDGAEDGDSPDSSLGRVEPKGSKGPLMIKGTCRSGMGIKHDGDVVVMGDVNPGAEITATGDVVVLGVLRGTAHAGTEHMDFSDAVIVALSLIPVQLRIGLHYTVDPLGKKKRAKSTYPEIAYVSGGSIVVEPLVKRIQRPKERNRLWQTIG